MVIDQRNAGASVTATGNPYTVDRFWLLTSQSGKFTAQQNAGSVTPPVGFTKYLGLTSSSAYTVTSSDYFSLIQSIEGFNVADLGWGTASAKTVTLSFQVYSSLTGTFTGSLQNNGQARSYPFTYTIPVANTWTTIFVTIPGDTSGTWLTNNGVGIYVFWSIGVGSTFAGTAGSWATGNYMGATGQTSVVGTNGATWYVTGAQLEPGSSATGFEYRQYQQELALCQRYYQLIQGAWGGGQSSTTVALSAQTFVVMRANPSVGQTGVLTVTNGNTDYSESSTGLNTYALNPTMIVIALLNYSGITPGATYFLRASNSNSLTLSAEL